MTYQQITLFLLLASVLGALLWGRFRYDLVAFTALVVGVILQVVPADTAFSGFGNDATIIVALVLIVTAGLTRSRAVDLVTRFVVDPNRSVSAHIGIIGSFGALISGFMNNVAALALLMPVDIQAAQKAGRSAGRTLMPLAIVTVLGGLLTVIGTPANLIIASYRETVTGTPFAMFDFTPVGLVCAVAGVAFVALVGWRLIPEQSGKDAVSELIVAASYTTEMVVDESSPAIGKRVRDLDATAEEHDCIIAGLVRRNKRLPGRARWIEIEAGDMLVVQGTPDALSALSGALGLNFQGKGGEKAALSSDLAIKEAVVGSNSSIVGRRANSIYLMRSLNVSLLGISRAGRIIQERVRSTPLEVGDVLLLLGPADTIDGMIARLDCLPIATSIQVPRRDKALMAIGLFAAAIVAGGFGLAPLTATLGLVAVLYVVLDILPIRELYDAIDWPVIVLLGALIPVGTALETSGATVLIAQGLAQATQALPPWVALTAVLVVTMMLSDVLNNAATAVIAAPVAFGLARILEVNPDTFLMAVTVGASCAFLTPIGHHNSALVMGPGGYRFSDYWRVGLPLEALIVVVSVPALLVFWPL